MSWNPALDPHCPKGDAVDAIETIIVPRARDLGAFEVRRALAANNYLAAIGSTKGALVQTYLAANTDLRDVDDFRRLVVARDGDTVVRLREPGRWLPVSVILPVDAASEDSLRRLRLRLRFSRQRWAAAE